VTARFTGGIGLNIAGSASVGGRRYVWLLGAIAGYFALASQRIPPDKAKLCATAFFLSPVTSAISDLTSFMGPSAVYYIFLLFPSNGAGPVETDAFTGPVQIERLGGITTACTAVFSTMLALLGIQGIFTLRKPWRAALFMTVGILSMFGGFRSSLLYLVLTVGMVFVLEGLLSSRLLPSLVCAVVLGCVILIPFTDRLPLSMQRALTVVPYLNLDESAVASAKGSTEWRLGMWRQVTPQIPRYLFLGKGYSINATELEKLKEDVQGDEGEAGAILAGDYHNGPLSVIMPFGIAGVIGFLWFIGAGIKVLYFNYKYGDPALRHVNTFFLAVFLTKVIFFFTIFGSLYSDMAIFTGLLGVNVSINGGMRQAVRVPKKRVSDAWKLARARPAVAN
jgi:O-antigen ligase